MEVFLLDQFWQRKIFSHQNQMTENSQSSISGGSISTINPMTKFKPLFNHHKNLAIECCFGHHKIFVTKHCFSQQRV